MSDNLYLVMPAWNEEATIEKTVGEWYAVVKNTGPDSRLVVFNDGSTDTTAAILDRLQKDYPQLIAVNKSNSGHGPTCLLAYQYAIKEGAAYVFQTDADGQTDPADFAAFWDKRKEADFIIGTRINRKEGWGRKLITNTLRLLILVVFGERVPDANTPFRLMNTQKLRSLLEIIPGNFFLSNVMISILVVKRKEKQLWLPVTFKPRTTGVSSVNFKRVFGIGFKAIGNFYRVKRKMKQAHA